ncbi:MAG: hypothetical protein IPJ13_20690 [Saprospiraceae bacterium]|nr:hypothetical protein [Saprospiraceae bacterium]
MSKHNLQLTTITQQRFYELWEETRSHVTDDENKIYQFFKPYIETIPKLGITKNTVDNHRQRLLKNLE